MVRIEHLEKHLEYHSGEVSNFSGTEKEKQQNL